MSPSTPWLADTAGLASQLVLGNSCLQGVRLELHVGAHALLAFVWTLGVGLCSLGGT